MPASVQFPVPTPHGEAYEAFGALLRAYNDDAPVVVGIFTSAQHGSVTHEALAVLVDMGLARYSTEGYYALLTDEGKSYVGQYL